MPVYVIYQGEKYGLCRHILQIKLGNQNKQVEDANGESEAAK